MEDNTVFYCGNSRAELAMNVDLYLVGALAESQVAKRPPRLTSFMVSTRP